MVLACMACTSHSRRVHMVDEGGQSRSCKDCQTSQRDLASPSDLSLASVDADRLHSDMQARVSDPVNVFARFLLTTKPTAGWHSGNAGMSSSMLGRRHASGLKPSLQVRSNAPLMADQATDTAALQAQLAELQALQAKLAAMQTQQAQQAQIASTPPVTPLSPVTSAVTTAVPTAPSVSMAPVGAPPVDAGDPDLFSQMAAFADNFAASFSSGRGGLQLPSLQLPAFSLVDPVTGQLPDWLPIGFVVLTLVFLAYQTSTLGNIYAYEARMAPASQLMNRNRLSKETFIQGKTRKRTFND